MKKYLFDTNAIIYFLEGNKFLNKYFNLISLEEAIGYYSFITKIELLSYPKIKQSEIIEINNFLFNMKYVDYIKEIEAPIIQHKRKHKGKLPDLIIGYTAKYLDAILITANESDFKHIRNLEIINPLK